MNNYDTFVTVVKLGSFSAAAKKLHKSPSAISKKIAYLEQTLNVQLFDRTTRSLVVTEAGQLYYERCIDIAKRIQHAESELKGFSDLPSGTLKITWPNVVSSSKIVDTLAEFTQAYPDIRVDVNVSNDKINLIDEYIDFAFRIAPLDDSTIVAIELLKIKPFICASPAFLSRHGAPSKIADLANMPLLLLNFSNLIQNSWKKLPGMKDLNIDDHHKVNDINALFGMVKKGIGATFLFRHTAEKELADGTLIDLFPDMALPEVPVYMMYHKLNYTPKKMRVFIDFFKEKYI